jgi:hypothetical protein
MCPHCEIVRELAEGRVGVHLYTQGVEEVERWHKEGSQLCHCLYVTLRQRVCHHVVGTGLVLNPKIEAKQFACPLVLWDCHQLLIKQELQTVIVSLNEKGMAPKVGTPMSHDED